jgi:hypothetical protein
VTNIASTIQLNILNVPVAQLLIDLFHADVAVDLARDELCEAKRIKGSWRVNPLGHDHPAVVKMREANTIRDEIIKQIKEVIK